MPTKEPEALEILRRFVRTYPDAHEATWIAQPRLLLRHEREIVDHVDKLTAERDALKARIARVMSGRWYLLPEGEGMPKDVYLLGADVRRALSPFTPTEDKRHAD